MARAVERRMNDVQIYPRHARGDQTHMRFPTTIEALLRQALRSMPR